MLAGRMKLKTFLGIAGAALVALLAGGYYACSTADTGPEEPIADDRPAETTPSPKPAEPQVARPKPVVAPPPAVDGPSERAADKAVMRFFGKDLGTKKRKDVTSGQPFKVNVYQDAGSATANRAKIDLDRDDKWDEKWTFKDGQISRKVSSADDESYDQEQVWKDGAWAAR